MKEFPCLLLNVPNLRRFQVLIRALMLICIVVVHFHQHFLKELIFLILVPLSVPVGKAVHDIGIFVGDDVPKVLDLSVYLRRDDWVCSGLFKFVGFFLANLLSY